MSSHSRIGYLLAAVMIVTAVYCVSRLAAARLRGRPAEPDVDIVHVLMGVAMAGMLVPPLRSLPDGAWEAAFGAALGWFGWQAIRAHRAGARAAHYLPHVLASGAMVYMFLAVPPARIGPALAEVTMDGQSAAAIRFPALALALAVALFGYVMWVTDRLPSVPSVSALRLAPAVVVPAWPGNRSQPGTGPQPGLAGQAGASRSRPAAGAPLSLRLAACCEIVMGLTMGYMLILAL
jgi:Domain of unknown function (DUF5134)